MTIIKTKWNLKNALANDPTVLNSERIYANTTAGDINTSILEGKEQVFHPTV